MQLFGRVLIGIIGILDEDGPCSQSCVSSLLKGLLDDESGFCLSVGCACKLVNQAEPAPRQSDFEAPPQPWFGSVVPGFIHMHKAARVLLGEWSVQEAAGNELGSAVGGFRPPPMIGSRDGVKFGTPA